MRYLKLLLVQVRISLVLGMQYRWEFLINAIAAVALFAWAFPRIGRPPSDRPPGANRLW